MSRPGWVEGGENPELPFSEQTTSKEAAEAIAPVAGSMRDRVLQYLRSCGSKGSTDDEGYHALGMRQVSYGARRNELVKAGLVEATGDKRVSTSGMQARVWRAK